MFTKQKSGYVITLDQKKKIKKSRFFLGAGGVAGLGCGTKIQNSVLRIGQIVLNI